MDKAQATALLNALEQRKLPCQILLRYDAGGNSVYSVELDPSFVYTGANLAALSGYCSANGLSLTATFSELGVT